MIQLVSLHGHLLPLAPAVQECDRETIVKTLLPAGGSHTGPTPPTPTTMTHQWKKWSVHTADRTSVRVCWSSFPPLTRAALASLSSLLFSSGFRLRWRR